MAPVKDAVDHHAAGRSALLMDARRMKILFQRRLPGFRSDALRIGDCVIRNARYRTSPSEIRKGKPFLAVCYEIQVEEAASGRQGVQVLLARAYPAGGSDRAFEEAKSRPLVPPAFGEGVARLSNLDFVVWAFPNDPRLPHLPEVIDGEAVRRHLPYESLPAGFRSSGEVTKIDVYIVRYKPEIRCITRYTLYGGDRGLKCLTLYGKTFRHERSRVIARFIETLSNRSFERPESFIVPPSLGCDDSVKTVWQMGLAGTPLPEIFDGDNISRFTELAARSLGDLHSLILEGLPHTTIGGILASVKAEASLLAQAFPRYRSQLDLITSRLEKEAQYLPACREGLVHGDFLLKQLVVHKNRLGIFDFDNLSVGDPTQDLANFLVDLHFGSMSASQIDAVSSLFLHSYRTSVDWEMPPARLRWHIAAQFVRSAYHFHKRMHLMRGFEDELQWFLALAERCFVEAAPPGDNGRTSKRMALIL